MSSPESETLPTNESCKHATLLVVEDDETISEFLTHVLQEQTPHAVLPVPDAARALAAVSSITPSLFLLDYQLPDMNGLDLSDRLHAIQGLERVPTLMMSADLPPRQTLQPRQIVPLKKPFDISDLLQAIERLLLPQET